MHTTRHFFPLVAFLLVAVPVPAQPPVAPAPHPALSQLLKDYKRYGLPFPPENAELVRIKWRTQEKEERFHLAFRIPPPKPGDEPRYLIGDWERGSQNVDPESVELVDPQSLLIDGLEMPIHILLGIAIQCEARGWHKFASAVYQQARHDAVKYEMDESMGELLVSLVDGYWAGQVTKRDSDRSEALRRLKVLAQEYPTLSTPADQEYLRKLELTVVPRKSKPGSVEALIDDLLDYHIDLLGESKPRDEAYWKLADLGFDAVPALLDHVQDDRYTRTIRFVGKGVWIETVGHVCSQLLNDLSARTIAGSLSVSGGHRFEKEDARKWFAEAQKVGEEKWLVDHAIPGKDAERIHPSSVKHIVRVIGVKYPQRLPEIYRTMLKRPKDRIVDVVDEIVGSKLPRDEKLALFEEGAKHENFEHRAAALRGLDELKSPLFRKYLLATMKQIATDARTVQDWSWTHDSTVCLVVRTDDRECWDLLLRIAKKLPVSERDGVVFGVCDVREKRAPPVRREQVRFLLQFLDDRDLVYDDEEMKLELRDNAAFLLAEKLGVKARRNPSGAITPHPDRGPLSRLLFREVLRELATRELAKGK